MLARQRYFCIFEQNQDSFYSRHRGQNLIFKKPAQTSRNELPMHMRGTPLQGLGESVVQVPTRARKAIGRGRRRRASRASCSPQRGPGRSTPRQRAAARGCSRANSNYPNIFDIFC